MEIEVIAQKATQEADKLLRQGMNLIDDIKKMLKAGSDTLTQSQVEEWLMVIPVMIAEISPVADAYELTQKLYKINSDQIEAKILLDTTEKGGRRDAIITVNKKEQEINKSIMYYVRDRARNMMDALHSLLMSLMKIWNGKAGQPKES